MCDHGADLNSFESEYMHPLLYAASNGYDDICLYLSLRVNDVDMEDPNTGENVFMIYMKQYNLDKMASLLTRGANVNYVNSVTNLTPLHFAIENNMRPSLIKFLIKNKANPHIEDMNGVDCCDKAAEYVQYRKLIGLRERKCLEKPKIRISINLIRQQ